MNNIDIKKYILQDFHLKNEDILSIFTYGSRVYGTHNEESDYDFIIVMKNEAINRDDRDSSTHNININLYSRSSFQELLTYHRHSAMECHFLPEEFILKNEVRYDFKFDIKKLIESISEKTSHCWVKSKKKFEVEKDRNVKTAKKSLFHCLRILDFGMQVAKYQKIVDYSSCNDLWEEIYTDPADKCGHYKEKYQKVFNERMSEFRKVAPK